MKTTLKIVLLVLGTFLLRDASAANASDANVPVEYVSIAKAPAPDASIRGPRKAPAKVPLANDSDLAIATEIRRTLRARKNFSQSARNVMVEVLDNKATLRGRVSSETERADVEDIVRNVGNVFEVVNGLVVQ